MRARLLPLLALAALLWAGNAAAFALSSGQAESPAFSFRLDRQAASGGELVQLKMEAGPAGKRAAGFRARVQYDGSALQYVETKTASRLGSGTVRVNGDSNPVYAVYVCGVGGKSAPSLSGTVLTFVFQVKSGAAGSAFLRADADDICDFSGSPLAPDCSSALWLETSPALSDEARLTALEPSAGTLEPENPSCGGLRDGNLHHGDFRRQERKSRVHRDGRAGRKTARIAGRRPPDGIRGRAGKSAASLFRAGGFRACEGRSGIRSAAAVLRGGPGLRLRAGCAWPGKRRRHANFPFPRPANRLGTAGAESGGGNVFRPDAGHHSGTEPDARVPGRHAGGRLLHRDRNRPVSLARRAAEKEKTLTTKKDLHSLKKRLYFLSIINVNFVIEVLQIVSAVFTPGHPA